MAIYQDAAEIRDRLIAAGVRATTDPRRVTPPCVLVAPQEVEFEAMCPGEGPTDWVLHCLSAPPGGEDALKSISQLVAAVLGVYPDAQDARLGSYQTDQGDAWPTIDVGLRTVSTWA